MTLAFHRLPALLVFVAGSLLASQGADARDLYRDDGGEAAVSSRQTPLFAVVALKEQRVTIYGARGKFLEAPVSTGISGRETPAGIFSIVQKEEYHRSNLYDDASMPFMERITWSGIALHAGVLPGYPASHGCVRMPENFAEKLYGLTEVGMRVMIVREDIAAAEVPQPQMFSAAAAPAGPDAMSRLRAAARAAASDRDIAKMQERDARAAVSKKNDELKAALRAEKNAQAAVSKAQGSLTAAERALEKAKPEKAAELEAAKVQAQAKLDAAQSLLRSAEAATAAKKEAALQAEAELRPAAAAYAKAADRADAAERDIHPVSVFISRKTQRLYIRKNHMPVFEAPVMIRDAWPAPRLVRVHGGGRSGKAWHPALDACVHVQGCCHCRSGSGCTARVEQGERPGCAFSAGACGYCGRTERARPHRDYGGGACAHLRGGPAGVVSDYLRRGPKPRNGQGYRFCRRDERRASRRACSPPRSEEGAQRWLL